MLILFRGRVRLILVHLTSQAERSHIGPDLLDIVETVGFRPRDVQVSPTFRTLSVNRPDGVLFLVVHYHLVLGLVLVSIGRILLLVRHLPFLHGSSTPSHLPGAGAMPTNSTSAWVRVLVTPCFAPAGTQTTRPGPHFRVSSPT